MTLVLLTLEISLIVGGALIATMLLRRRSAALRHWLLAAAIACAAAAPLVAPIAPSWHLRGAASVQPVLPDVSIAIATASDRSDASAPARATVEPADANRPSVAVALLRLVWIGGILACLGSLAIGLGRLWWIAAHASPVADAAWREHLERASRECAVRRRVALLESDRPALLVTWGFARPQIILPPGALAWPVDRIRVVLCHELAHVARGDWLVQMLAELLRSLYWFNPVIWLAAARLREEGEHACDDAVLNRGIDASAYASQLLDLARAARRRQPLPAQAMLRPSSLERRISAMLNARINHAPVSRRTRLAAAAGFAAATIALAGLTAVAQDQTVFSGTVVDVRGRPIPSPSIVLTSADDSARHEVRGDESGHFQFVALPSGRYALSAEAFGFAPLHEAVTLSGRTMQQTLPLAIARVQEMIRVTELPPPAPPAPGPDRQRRQREFRQKMADRCAQAPASACLEAPIKLKDVRPVFPPSLAGSRAEQTVTMHGVIGVDGFIHDLEVTADAIPGDVASAAMAAVSQWQFEPTRLDGQPVETGIDITVRFAPAR